MMMIMKMMIIKMKLKGDWILRIMNQMCYKHQDKIDRRIILIYQTLLAKALTSYRFKNYPRLKGLIMI